MYVRTAGPDRGATPVLIYLPGGGNNTRIRNNTINNGFILIELSCGGSCSNNEVSGNILEHMCRGISVNAGSNNVVVNSTRITNNTLGSLERWGSRFNNCTGDCHYHCEDIMVHSVQSGSVINDLEIGRNTLRGPIASYGGANQTSARMFISAAGVPTRISNPVIHNNVVVGASGTDGKITITAANPKFLNNTIVGMPQGTIGPAISFYFAKNVVVKNNLIGGGQALWDNSDGGTTWADVNNNGYYDMQESAFRWGCGQSCWQALGRDTNGVFGTDATSLGVSTSTWQLSTGSRLIDAGANISNYCSACAVDRVGTTRPQGGGWDIGSYEFGGGTQPLPEPSAPSPPTNVRLISSSATIDTVPPSVPQGMAFSGKTQTTVSLVWLASTDNVGVAGYHLSRDNVRIASTQNLAFTFTGLACGTTYTFGLEAYDAAGNVSNRAEATGSISTNPCDG